MRETVWAILQAREQAESGVLRPGLQTVTCPTEAESRGSGAVKQGLINAAYGTNIRQVRCRHRMAAQQQFV